jgi:hypothetical protein
MMIATYVFMIYSYLKQPNSNLTKRRVAVFDDIDGSPSVDLWKENGTDARPGEDTSEVRIFLGHD